MKAVKLALYGEHWLLQNRVSDNVGGVKQFLGNNILDKIGSLP